MPAEDALLFIDANKYLDLYQTATGRKLLAPLGEQAAYVFVTQQVVDEVLRNKIKVVSGFLNEKFKELKPQTFAVPDHLFGTSAEQSKDIREDMADIGQKINTVNEKVDTLAMGIMAKISQSQDDVSKALAPIFAKAVAHSPEELQRARERKELGNPPGKPTNPIGDQLTWEQILSQFKGKKKLWIISRDGDYGTFHGKKGFLNQFLYEELRKLNPDAEAFLFEDIVAGIKDFADKMGVKADKLPTPEETKEIREEEGTLPPLGGEVVGTTNVPYPVNTDSVMARTLNLAATGVVMPNITSQGAAANFNTVGPTNYLAGTGPTNYLPATGPTSYLSATGPTNYLAGTGPTNYLPATGPTNYLAGTGPTNYLPATGPTNCLAGTGPTGNLAGIAPTNNLTGIGGTVTMDSQAVAMPNINCLTAVANVTLTEPTVNLAATGPTHNLAATGPTNYCTGMGPTGTFAGMGPTNYCTVTEPTVNIVATAPTVNLAGTGPTGTFAGMGPTNYCTVTEPTVKLAATGPTNNFAGTGPTIFCNGLGPTAMPNVTGMGLTTNHTGVGAKGTFTGIGPTPQINSLGAAASFNSQAVVMPNINCLTTAATFNGMGATANAINQAFWHAQF